ncbi:hypothetical protein QQ045_015846 [Rhodiola kirilowii]
MPRSRDEPPAVRVYTVCDESKYLIVRNVPSLGCGDELLELFSSYGEVEECKPMDAEDCEEYTDVFWIKFRLVSNSRFAKRKLDEYVFVGNRLQVSYAPQFENLSDTKEKLESRGKEVNSRLITGKTSKFEVDSRNASINHGTFADSTAGGILTVLNNGAKTDSCVYEIRTRDPQLGRVSSDQDYFPSQSMNQTVKLVRDRLSKIQSSGEADPATKKPRLDNRRRI